MNATLTAWLAACALAFVLGGAYLLDGPDDHSFEVAQSQALKDAQRAAGQAAAARARFERAAALLCGENAAWSELDGGAVQCRTKHGRKTITAQVADAQTRAPDPTQRSAKP